MASINGENTNAVKARLEKCLEEIDNWERNIKDHLTNLCGTPSNFEMPEIVLDGEKKVNYTEGLSPEEVREKVRKILDRNRETVDGMQGGQWLKSCFDEEPPQGEGYPSWRREYSHANFSNRAKEIIREIDGVVSQQRMEDKLLGLYTPATNTITLYYNNIAKWKTDSSLCEPEPRFDEVFIANLRMTLAHEMFHAYHKNVAEKTFFGIFGYVEVVKEALADFYAYLYCMDADAALADGVSADESREAAWERSGEWESKQCYNWPYAYARFFMNNEGKVIWCEDFQDCVEKGMVEKFRCILELSKTDMYRAYCELVPPEFRRDYHSQKIKIRRKRKTSWVINLDDTGVPLTREDYWEILKKVIKIQDVESFDELKVYFPDDVLRLEEGEFVMLGNGQIICAENHWEVLKGYDFLVIAKELGVPITFRRQTDAAGNLIAIIRGQAKPGEYAMATGKYGTRDFSFICDFSTYAVIRVGDTFIAPFGTANTQMEFQVEKLELVAQPNLKLPLNKYKKVLKVK